MTYNYLEPSDYENFFRKLRTYAQEECLPSFNRGSRDFKICNSDLNIALKIEHARVKYASSRKRVNGNKNGEDLRSEDIVTALQEEGLLRKIETPKDITRRFVNWARDKRGRFLSTSERTNVQKRLGIYHQ